MLLGRSGLRRSNANEMQVDIGRGSLDVLFRGKTLRVGWESGEGQGEAKGGHGNKGGVEPASSHRTKSSDSQHDWQVENDCRSCDPPELLRPVDFAQVLLDSAMPGTNERVSGGPLYCEPASETSCPLANLKRPCGFGSGSHCTVYAEHLGFSTLSFNCAVQIHGHDRCSL